MNKLVKFKDSKKIETLMYLHPLISMVMFDMAYWCMERNIEFVVTDTISSLKRDNKLGRVSDSHRTRRAFDLRSRAFSREQMEDFQEFFNNKYEDIASVSRKDLIPRLVVLHGNGNNEHFHVALNYRYRMSE